MPIQTYLFALLGMTTVPLVQSTAIFASSYSGKLHTLELSSSHSNVDDREVESDLAKSPGFHLLHSSPACGPSPTWLTLDPTTSPPTLYCVNEGISTPNGSFTSFSVDRGTSALHKLGSAKTLSGPVAAVVYGHGESKELLLAHYAAGALSAFSVKHPVSPHLLSEEDFKLAKAGPVPDRQDASHAHDAILDPTGKFVLVPDLGADLVRILRHDAKPGVLSKLPPLQVEPGSGPRHAAFWSPAGLARFKPGEDELYMLVVTELANTVTSYRATYKDVGGKDASLSFTQVHKSNTFGGKPVPASAAAAEIVVTGKFFYVSNRSDQSFALPKSEGGGRSDSIAGFAMNPNGSFEFKHLAPAGGQTPRNFAISKKGDRVAVALQGSEAVVVLSRDVESGKLGEIVATKGGLGPVTSVLWFED